MACVLFDRARGRVTKQTVRLDRSVKMIVGGMSGLLGLFRNWRGQNSNREECGNGSFSQPSMAHPPHNHHLATLEVVVDTYQTPHLLG